MCVCSLSYPAYNARALYCHLRPVRLCHIFPHYLTNGMVFGKSYWIKNEFFYFLYIVSAKFLTLRRIQPDITTNVHWSSGKVTAKLVRFEQNFNCFKRFSKNPQTRNFLKICPVGAEWFHADRRTDTTKLTVAFHNKTNTLTKKSSSMFVWPCITDTIILNSQLDATITNFSDNYIQLSMFRAIISPILRSTRLCLQLMVQCTGGATSRQHLRRIIPQAVNKV